MEMPTHHKTFSTGKLFAIRDEIDGSAAHLQLQIEYLEYVNDQKVSQDRGSSLK